MFPQSSSQPHPAVHRTKLAHSPARNRGYRPPTTRVNPNVRLLRSTRYGGDFGPLEAERLLWRAGFGPSRGDVDRSAGLTMTQAVRRLTRSESPSALTGPPPRQD